MSQSKIPTGKVARAMRLAGAGAKVARNSAVHLTKKSLGLKHSKAELDANNARDLYRELGSLKGSALKMAQMLSQDQNILPQAYQDQFQMAQYSAPPLSYPLVERVFRKELGASPLDVFDEFEREAAHAASIGQVHIARKGGVKFAVKIQYPGVAESIASDLALAKPFAAKILGLNASEINHYFSEVKDKMIEETDYRLEKKQGEFFAEQLRHVKGLRLPKFFPEYSGRKVLTMEYLEGQAFDQFAKHGSLPMRQAVGQRLWDIFDRQMRRDHHVHADPHPGNFLVSSQGELMMLDFGCTKKIPDSFHLPFFKMMQPEYHDQLSLFKELLFELDMLHGEDSPDQVDFFMDTYRRFVKLLGEPFFKTSFDFSDDHYFKAVTELSKQLQSSAIYKNSKRGRGSKHGLYVNRAYFGLYNLLHLLRVEVKTGMELSLDSVRA